MPRSLLLFLLSLLFVGCIPVGSTPDDDDSSVDDDDTDDGWIELEPGLEIRDTVVGDGDEVVSGDNITAHYTLWLWEDGAEGELIESSTGGNPFSATIGVGQLIEGWDRGIPGMHVGGTRQLIIGPDLAYGASGAGQVPPNATLLFEVELLNIN